MSQIDLREAVNAVKNYIVDFKGDLGSNFDNLLIEETELSEDGKFWLITIGFDREVDPQQERIYVNNPLHFREEIADLFPKRKRLIIERVYKIFKVDSSTGKIVSMKMYKL